MTKKILLIEDDSDLSSSLAKFLEPIYEVVMIDRGQAGFECAKKDRPDLVVLDIKLPDIDGTEVLRQLKADPVTENIPVIILTNFDDQHTVSSIIAAGGRAYLIKSDWGLPEIAEKIRGLIG